ncbi:MAG: sterol desaturase family protein [Candidatus Cyclobacteriaceae bacterium M3_2C_046]
MKNTEKTGVKTKGSGKLFNNPILEKLTRTHIAIPITVLAGSAIGLMIYGIYHGFIDYATLSYTFLIGLVLFTLAEYILHRYLYHLAPSSESRKKLQYTIHGIHHEYPNDKQRQAMPPIISVILAVVLFLLFLIIVGPYAFGFAPGFYIGYSIYLFIHYSIHAFSPPKNILKTLWIHHNIHHFKQSHRAYGVSSPLWDYVFGTMPEKKH